MMIIFIFALLLGLAFGQNSHGFTLDQVLDLVVADLDKNHDGIITFTELEQEMITRWEHDGDGVVTIEEFRTFMHHVHPEGNHGHGG